MLVVWKLDRLGRNLAHLVNTVQDLSARGVGLRVLAGQGAPWFTKRPRFHVHFTPTYGSWLNLIERWFAELTTKQLRRGVYRSVRALEAAIQEFIAAHNAQGTPFVWTKTADEILASIARFARRTLSLQQAH